METRPIPKLFTSTIVPQSVVSSSDNSDVIHTVHEKVTNEEKEIVKIEEKEDNMNVDVKEEEKVQSGEEEKMSSVSEEKLEKSTSNQSEEKPEKSTLNQSDEQPEKSISNQSDEKQDEKHKPTEVSNNTPPPKPKRQNPLFIGEIEDDFDLNDPYFDHHGNITSFMETYVKLHDKLTSMNSKRCVIYLPMKETGLGNSLLALSSSFLYAALTKRAFLCIFH